MLFRLSLRERPRKARVRGAIRSELPLTLNVKSPLSPTLSRMTGEGAKL